MDVHVVMTAAVDLCEEAGDNDGHNPGYRTCPEDTHK